MRYISLYIFFSFTLIACQKPQIATIPSAPSSQPPALTITGYYNLQTCRYFLDARLTPNGELVHDDTTEPQSCDEENPLFQLETFRFPIPEESDLHGLRITLNQHLLIHPYHFVAEGLKLSTPQSPDVVAQATHLYTFATPGKQHLQVFFSAADWQQILSNSDQLELSFQLRPCPQLPAPCANPEFTLIQGHYDPKADRITDLVNFQNLPDLIGPKTPELYFDLIEPPLGVGSAYILRIRSIYHLLTEDFALWNDNEDCQALQNWDLSLIPATGYNLLEIKIDPPFLECLGVGEGGFNFRIALLR